MPEWTKDFQSLPAEYQHVIRLGEERHTITIAPLQLLVGGWSGAVVYLVSVTWNGTNHVEHCILKLDHKSKNARSDEVTRHNTVQEKSAPDFVHSHIPKLVFEAIEADGAIAIFYSIAGESLLTYRPLSNYQRQSQIQAIFTQTNSILLTEWNQRAAFEQSVHPQLLLEKWLGFRLDVGGSIEKFLSETRRVDPSATGLLVNGHVLPNPLLFARNPELWGNVRLMDAATGMIHGDLNTNNILVRFNEDKETLAGYYMIDLALFKDNMPLLYDQRYLEMSYLLQAMPQVALARYIHFLTLLAVADVPDPHRVPIEVSGVSTVIGAARNAFAEWVKSNHPSLHDDLWGQYWLAGVAAGLAYCHKAGQPEELRLAGLIFAAANLKRYAFVFKLPQPTTVEFLYDENETNAPKSKRAMHNLPAQPTPFIGRTAHLHALKELITSPNVRLITLLGPGGTGKTRLSVQVAEEVLDHFRHGVIFVPLADDIRSDQFISRVAQQLDVREGGRPLLDNVKDFLRDKQLLLILDNFEQLVSSAPVVADLLSAAPQLKVIVSSRISLKLQAEREYPVPPLEVPQRESTLDQLTDYESVRLFVEHAHAAQPTFSLTEENASSIAEICFRLDGLPLALELAAARVKLLSPQAILARLDDQLKLLTGGARDLPTRHQTLRNTLQWSYNLLNENERMLYARLGVFVGGFTLEAAETVCNRDGAFDILDTLTALVDNSLLRQVETQGGEPRFSMLETIRTFAVERLVESGEMPALQVSHAKYFADIILQRAGLEIYSVKSQHWLTWYEQELDNIRTTLAWCLTSPEALPNGVGLLYMLFWFWYRRGHFMEGQQWAEKFLAIPSLKDVPPLHATALASSGILALWQGQQEIAHTRLQEALAIQQRLEDELMMAGIQMVNAIAFINMGRDHEAKPLLEQASKYFKEAGNTYFHALTLVHLGNAELGLGHPERAHAYHSEAEAQARGIKENWLISFALNNLGEVARTQGQYDLARKYYEQCEALLPNSGDEGDRARFVHSLGYIALHEGHFERAESQFRQGLVLFRRLGNRRGMAECMAGLAGLKAHQGNVEWGAVMLSAAETLLKATGGAWWPADRVEVEANQEFIRLALDEEKRSAAQKRGGLMTLEQALTFASDER